MNETIPIDKNRVFFFFPVFFHRELLDDLKSKGFKVDMATKYLGDIWKGNEWNITFGISPKGFVHVWLGDLIDRVKAVDDYRPFLKHAVRPDRLGKHFTKTQLEAQFASDEDEN